MINKTGFILTAALLSSSIGCNSGASTTKSVGIDGITHSEASEIAKKNSPVVGTSCKSDDPNHICLALKYVVYKDGSGQALMSSEEVNKSVQGINKVWKQCNLAFQVDEFVSPSPEDYGLRFHTAENGELDEIRRNFDDNSTLLVVTTGPWNRNGSLGYTGANAWTSMPGEQLYGAILESTVKSFSNIIAHELGHYLNLQHVSDASDLMNPIIYDNSEYLNSDQCNVARETVSDYWQKMVR